MIMVIITVLIVIIISIVSYHYFSLLLVSNHSYHYLHYCYWYWLYHYCSRYHCNHHHHDLHITIVSYFWALTENYVFFRFSVLFVLVVLLFFAYFLCSYNFSIIICSFLLMAVLWYFYFLTLTILPFTLYSVLIALPKPSTPAAASVFRYRLVIPWSSRASVLATLGVCILSMPSKATLQHSCRTRVPIGLVMRLGCCWCLGQIFLIQLPLNVNKSSFFSLILCNLTLAGWPRFWSILQNLGDESHPKAFISHPRHLTYVSTCQALNLSIRSHIIMDFGLMIWKLKFPFYWFLYFSWKHFLSSSHSLGPASVPDVCRIHESPSTPPSPSYIQFSPQYFAITFSVNAFHSPSDSSPFRPSTFR